VVDAVRQAGILEDGLHAVEVLERLFAEEVGELGRRFDNRVKIGFLVSRMRSGLV
jgi:hypothetical protein